MIHFMSGLLVGGFGGLIIGLLLANLVLVLFNYYEARPPDPPAS